VQTRKGFRIEKHAELLQFLYAKRVFRTSTPKFNEMSNEDSVSLSRDDASPKTNGSRTSDFHIDIDPKVGEKIKEGIQGGVDVIQSLFTGFVKSIQDAMGPDMLKNISSGQWLLQVAAMPEPSQPKGRNWNKRTKPERRAIEANRRRNHGDEKPCQRGTPDKRSRSLWNSKGPFTQLHRNRNNDGNYDVDESPRPHSSKVLLDASQVPMCIGMGNRV
jgi:hypothetical protein